GLSRQLSLMAPGLIRQLLVVSLREAAPDQRRELLVRQLRETAPNQRRELLALHLRSLGAGLLRMGAIAGDDGQLPTGIFQDGSLEVLLEQLGGVWDDPLVVSGPDVAPLCAGLGEGDSGRAVVASIAPVGARIPDAAGFRREPRRLRSDDRGSPPRFPVGPSASADRLLRCTHAPHPVRSGAPRLTQRRILASSSPAGDGCATGPGRAPAADLLNPLHSRAMETADPFSKLHEEAQRRWPTIEVPVGAFAAHARERGHTAPSTLEANAADFFLAFACGQSLPQALQLLEQQYLPRAREALLRRGMPHAQVDEVLQNLRERLLVARDGARPRIADYDGRGPLTAWLRT